jgi:hypothetical protein
VTVGAAKKSVFVFSVVGEEHVSAANVALAYLKRFSRADIVFIKARSESQPAHDQVINVEPPAALDNHQASIFLKTNLLSFVGGTKARFCYLDSDVIAVSDYVDTIFNYKTGPVTFAADHADIDMFSRYGVDCRCRETRCPHLREAIICSFGIEVRRCDWKMWNGGVFLFDHDSAGFFDQWHLLTRQILSDQYWHTRDQGTLAAAVWKCGMENQPTLPTNFNVIVDRFWGIPPDKRSRVAQSQFHVRTDYSLRGERGLMRPSFLHFINGGVEKTGWHNWDQVAALIQTGTDSEVLQKCRS